MKETTKIRERGQMTLPAEFRDVFSWLQPGSIVEVLADQNKDSIVVRPYQSGVRRTQRAPFQQPMTMSWEEIEKRLERARSEGDKRAKLSEFIIKDREKRKYEI